MKRPVLCWLGCTTRLRAPRIAEATFKILHSLFPGEVTCLRDEELCCGRGALCYGYVKELGGYVKRVVELILNTNASLIVTPCPACYRTFARDYRDIFGVKLPNVKHLTEIIAEAIKEGKLALQGESMKGYRKVAYHDPCELGRRMGVFEEPRFILRRLPGIELVEFEERMEDSLCCGGGGGIWGLHPEVSMAIASERLREARRLGVDAIVSACPQCYVNFRYASERYDIPIKVIDISQLVAESLAIP